MPLTGEHIAQLDRDAPAALGSRGRAFFAERSLTIAEVVLVSCVALAALWIWAAQPLTMLLLLLTAAWLGIIGEWAQALLLRKAVEHGMAVNNADNFVWQVTSALMARRDTIIWSPTEVPTTLRSLLIVDLICISAATVIALLMLREGGHDPARLLLADTKVIVLFTLTFVL